MISPTEEPFAYLALRPEQRTPSGTEGARREVITRHNLMPVPIPRPTREMLRKRAANRRNCLAKRQKAALMGVLGCRCAQCGSTDKLTIDHVFLRTWDLHSRDAYGRVRKYWEEYRIGVPLQILCRRCNSAKGRPPPPF